MDTETKEQRPGLATKNSQVHHKTNSTAGHENSPGLTQAEGATKEQPLKGKNISRVPALEFRSLRNCSRRFRHKYNRMEAKCAAIWSSLDARSEESEMIAHLQSMFWSNSDVAANYCSPNTSASSCVTASTAPSSLFLPLDNEGYYTAPSSLFLPLDNEGYYTAPMVNTGMDLCIDHRHQTITGHKRVSRMDEQVKKTSKKSRTVPSVTEALVSSLTDKETNAGIVNQSSSSCCSSVEDSIGTSEKSIVPNQSDNARGCKRPSKNLQSLYAKKRRERINEKLRVLQQLIPNGTKVDISTMLEDAVQYVKFLQLQIKVLSSDETWMYAPLAYNGMDISLSLRTGGDQE
nr:uncharacterized protein LOC127347615 [Lolium perenne]